MTDGTQAVVWDAVYKPFGEVHSITGSATLNLRFPGQYFLIENGLHYNWHRHYDPTLGRYTQPDPISDRAATTASSQPMDSVIATIISGMRSPSSNLRYPDRMPAPFQDGSSLYSYARSNPVIYPDPSGLDVTVCFYGEAAYGFGHVGFGVGEDQTYGFYPREGSSGPGEIYEDRQPGGQCKLIKSRADQDQCMLQCRSTRSANPGPYNLFNRQCTRFVRDCLIQCGLSAGSGSQLFPASFFKGLAGTRP
jgi:RHS repeat-associated protein